MDKALTDKYLELMRDIEEYSNNIKDLNTMTIEEKARLAKQMVTRRDYLKNIQEELTTLKETVSNSLLKDLNDRGIEEIRIEGVGKVKVATEISYGIADEYKDNNKHDG